MKQSGKKIRKVIFWVTYAYLLLFFLWHCIFNPVSGVFIPLTPLGYIYTDVAKRIKSPDYSKMAILIRRNAFDLNFEVKIKENLKTRTLHWTRDFYPELTADFNEKIIWSDDSNLLVLTIEDVFDDHEKYMWAYDFANNKEYFDKEKITEMLNDRNAILKELKSETQ